MKILKKQIQQKVVRIFTPTSEDEVLNVSLIGAATHYNKIKEFNTMLIDYQSLFHPKQIGLSVYKEPPPNLFSLEKTAYNNEITTCLNTLKKSANSKNALSRTMALDSLNSFKRICELLDREFSWMDADLIVAPLKGGGVITDIMNISNKSIAIEGKRIPLSRGYGYFGFGLNVPINRHGKLYKDLNTNTNLKISMVEDCVASGMTTISFLIYLMSLGVNIKQLNVIASICTIAGAIKVQQISNELQIPINIQCGKVFYNLTDYYEDIRTDSIIYPSGDLALPDTSKVYNMINKPKME